MIILAFLCFLKKGEWWGPSIKIFVEDQELYNWNVYILLFVLFVRIVTAFVNILGSARAFGDFILNKK